jgi:phosphoglycolate phosphatase-like HAD superfamily hydrolase
LSLQEIILCEQNKLVEIANLKFSLGIPGETTLSMLGMTDIKKSNDKWNELYRGLFHTVKLFDDIKETLMALKRGGFSLGVVTSKTEEELLYDFEHFSLMQYFDCYICADDTIKHKPAPEPILKYNVF